MIDIDILRHYLQTSTYTYAGAYTDYFRSLPNEPARLVRIVCDQVIHPSFFYLGASEYLQKTYYGDLEKYSIHRFYNEDEMFLTAAAMTAELFRLDSRGFVSDRDVGKRLAVTCRHAAVLMSAVMKAKGTPCRCRAGFMDFDGDGASYMEHWVNEYLGGDRWALADADGYYEYERRFGYGEHDLPRNKFISAAEAWLGVRRGTFDRKKLQVGETEPGDGLHAYLMYDFHALMNDEIFYTFLPEYKYGVYARMTDEDLRELDALAELMLDPDTNFSRLCAAWDDGGKFVRLTNQGTELYGKIFGK